MSREEASCACKPCRSQSLRRFWAPDFHKPGQIDFQDFAIQKEQRRQGLLMGRDGHPTLGGKLCEKSFDFLRPHLPRMTKLMKADERPHPMNILLLAP
jgi:hypothetical protein